MNGPSIHEPTQASSLRVRVGSLSLFTAGSIIANKPTHGQKGRFCRWRFWTQKVWSLLLAALWDQQAAAAVAIRQTANPPADARACPVSGRASPASGCPRAIRIPVWDIRDAADHELAIACHSFHACQHSLASMQPEWGEFPKGLVYRAV